MSRAGAMTGQDTTGASIRGLAGYCLHALTSASGLPSAAAVRRLVAVTLSGLRPRQVMLTPLTARPARRAAARLPATPITPIITERQAAAGPASRRGGGKADDGGAVPRVALALRARGA